MTKQAWFKFIEYLKLCLIDFKVEYNTTKNYKDLILYNFLFDVKVFFEFDSNENKGIYYFSIDDKLIFLIKSDYILNNKNINFISSMIYYSFKKKESIPVASNNAIDFNNACLNGIFRNLE